jgi:lipoate-protein ligase A
MNSDELQAHMHSAIEKVGSTDEHVSLTDGEFAALTICRLQSALGKLVDERPLDAEEFEAVEMAANHEITRLEDDEKTWLKP